MDDAAAICDIQGIGTGEKQGTEKADQNLSSIRYFSKTKIASRGSE